MKTIFKFALLMISGYIVSSCEAISVRTDMQAVANIKTVELIAEQQTLPEDAYLKYPFRVRLINDKMYIMDLHPEEYYCQVFDYPSMAHRYSVARRGDAPNEFLGAENIRVDHKGNLYILDANKKRIVQFDQANGQSVGEVELDLQLIRTLDFDFQNDSTIVVPDYTGEHRFSFLDREGQLRKQTFHIPTSKEEQSNVSTVVRAQAWRPFIDYNADHGILAAVTQLGQVLELYDIKRGKTINLVHAEKYGPQYSHKGNYAIPTGIMGYSDVHIGKDHIYAIFWGHAFDDIRQNGNEQKEGGRFIHVFDLKGRPVRQYTLDRHITGFHVDEENRKIIGVDPNSNQPLVVFNFDTIT